MKPYNGLHETEGCRAILKDQYKALKVRARRVLGRAMRQEIEDYGNYEEEAGTEVKAEENKGKQNRWSTEKETNAQAETETEVREAQVGEEKEVPDNWNHRPSWVWERDGCGLP